MVAKYNISTFGRKIVIFESKDEFTNLRLFFVVGTIIFGFATLFLIKNLWKNLVKKQNQTLTKKMPFLVKLTYFLFFCNILFHDAHYADNIYRPVDYHEPKWLYDKYLFSTMEITFFANFPISIIGLLALKNLFDFEKNRGLIINR